MRDPETVHEVVIDLSNVDDVAKAIAKSWPDSYAKSWPWENIPEPAQQAYRQQARAAILAAAQIKPDPPAPLNVHDEVTTRTANVQRAPWPTDLEEMVAELNHRPRWRVELGYVYRGQDCEGLTLSVYITEPDAYHSGGDRSVVHYFPVPPAAYDYRSWRRWLFDCLREVSTHEEMEHFTIGGEKPYAPSHGPGNNPYIVREVGTEIDRRTSFRGEVNPQ